MVHSIYQNTLCVTNSGKVRTDIYSEKIIKNRYGHLAVI